MSFLLQPIHFDPPIEGLVPVQRLLIEELQTIWFGIGIRVRVVGGKTFPLVLFPCL